MYGKVVASIAGFLVVGAVLTQAFPSQMNSLFGNDAATAISPKISTTKNGLDVDVIATKIFQLSNEERINAGLKAVEWDDILTEAGNAHAQDMALNHYFEHNSLDGSTPTDRAKALGYSCFNPPYYGIAENIVMGGPHYGQNTVDSIANSAVDAWMNSELHRQNILTPQHHTLGVGVFIDSDGVAYLSQEFC